MGEIAAQTGPGQQIRSRGASFDMSVRSAAAGLLFKIRAVGVRKPPESLARVAQLVRAGAL